MARLTAVLENLDRNMTELVQIGKAQVRLETQQLEDRKAIDRAFGAIDDQGKAIDVVLGKHDERIKKLEDDAPKNNLMAGWALEVVKWLAIAGVGALIGQSLF